MIEQAPTDTVDYADIVLPSTMQTEHADVHDGYGHLYLAWNEPAVAPPGECLPHTEIFRRLARAMGLEEPALYDDDLTLARTLVESGHPTLEGITVERLRREGWVRLGHPHPLVPVRGRVPDAVGRLELHSERAAAAGHDPLPGYTPPAEAADPGEDRLALIAAASHWFLNSMFANAPEQRRRAGAPTVALHPDDAAARGLAAGSGSASATSGAPSRPCSPWATPPAAASRPRPRATGPSCSPAARTSTPRPRSATPTSAAAPCSTTAPCG